VNLNSYHQDYSARAQQDIRKCCGHHMTQRRISATDIHAARAPDLVDPQRMTVAISRLRIRHLQMLDALERLGSLRRAAVELGVTQPAAIALVNDMEYAFGAPLVVRDRSGTTLTQPALALAARARVAVEEITRAKEQIQRTAQPGARLRLGASPYLISALIPGMVALLQEQLPGVAIEIHEGTLDELVADLARGELDAVLGSVERAAVLASLVELEATFLSSEPMCIAASKGHPLFGRKNATLDEVLSGPWVLPLVTSHIREVFDSGVFDAGHPPVEPLVECRGILNMLGLASMTRALTVAPQSEIARRTWRGRITQVASPLLLAAPPYAFVNRRYKQQMPAVLALRHCALSVAREAFTAPAV
jgi:molybdate transport repressor ModE-like protein